jgi:ribose transport system ATP-binding protein
MGSFSSIRDNVLSMSGIRKEFPGVVALDNVQFDLYRGEVHVVLGENGAGKSTLMKILSGAYQQDAGKIMLLGHDIVIRGPRHAQELGIAIIYQELNLVPHLTVAENIFLGREPALFGVLDQSKLFELAQAQLDQVRMSIDVRARVRDLSVAQQQMVEVAKALSLQAKILIMDEPTSALTEREIQELFTTIRRLKEQGVSIIYISHRIEEIFRIGDRVTVLRDGKYVGTYAVAEVTKPFLIRQMVNRELKEQFPKAKAQVGEEVLRVEQLTRKGVLNDISFSLRRGEVLGIAGLLGAGRTELARAIFGLDTIDSGAIYVDGKRCEITSPRAAIDHGIAFLTEDRRTQGLVLKLSVKENILLPSMDLICRRGIIDTEAEKIIATRYADDLRIKTPSIDQRVLFLSGGNQQKVVVSKWLSTNARVLIFDEPTRGIDIGAKVEIYQLMNRLTAEGAAIIMISSELPEVLGMSDRILVMHQGKITGEFTAEEATQEKILHCALGTYN